MQISRVWIGLIIIILIYGFAYQGYEGLYYFNNASTQYKHIINYALLLIVAMVGYWGWQNYKKTWVKQVWVLLYSAVITLITIIGIYDLIFYIKNEGLREFLHGFRFFFISPLPFGLLLFLSRYIEQSENKTG